MYIRIKNIKQSNGNRTPYVYLCKSIRDGKKIRQITLKYLGKISGLEIIKKEDIDKLLKKYDYSCNECKTDRNLSIEHIIPLSKNGTNEFNNLQILCLSCNQKKGNRIT